MIGRTHWAWVLLFVTALVIVTAGAFLWQSRSVYAPEAPFPENFEPYQATLQGIYVCLPHTDTSGPQTLECALGLQIEDEEFYALDFNAMPGLLTDIPMGSPVEASGTVTPVERLSSDHWRIYPIKGIFSVTSFTKL